MTFLFISDDPKRSAEIINKLGNGLPLKVVALSDYCADSARPQALVIIDINLTDGRIIGQFRDKFRNDTSVSRRVFVTHGNSQAETYQANGLGATAIISAEINKSDALKLMELCAQSTRGKRWCGVPEKTVKAIEEIGSLHDSLYHAVASGGPLPKAHVDGASKLLAESLKDNSIGPWLDAVKQHNSYTYRHCMTVSGLAVAFAMHLGFNDVDVQRMGVGGLIHDIGKVRIPISILDKPGKLSAEERAQINKHPGYGAEILRSDGQFDDELLDITLHHHELLDGTGYPDGLSGDQISDPVRIMTIVDIYSALIDKRSYKEAIPAEKAYQILLDMDGKLDRDILKAFKPTALAVQSSTQDAATHQAMAS